MQELTPPDTIAVKQQLLKQREAIESAQLDLDVYAGAGTPMETPMLHGGGGAGKRAGTVAFAVPDTPLESEPRSASQVVSDVLLYQNPPLTYVTAAAGVLVLAAAWFALRGAHGLTLLTATCYVLLADLALNFLRSLVSKQWQEAAGWAASAAAAAVAQRAADGVAALARLHDAYLLCRDPVVALKTGATLWALAVLGSFLSLWSLAVLAFVAAFTLPAAYSRHREAVKAAYQRAMGAAAARWNALGLSRKQKALVLALLLGSLWLRSAWSTRFVALLVGALAVRCHLKPAEVERIIAIAEPYTMSVRKRASRMSLAAADFAMRSVGGKTHMR
ncbi:hypothetical protein ABPG77_001851 [Micractinium sp. CCAP 211/92]